MQAPAANAMILSTAATCHTRSNQTIFLSTQDGASGSWVYRQLIDARSGYSTLQITDDGMIANLYEQGGCSFTLALVDPKAMIADGPQGAVPCADAHCSGGVAPSPTPSPKTSYCEAPPPPPPSPACQKLLDAYCNNASTPSMKDCLSGSYPGCECQSVPVTYYLPTVVPPVM